MTTPINVTLVGATGLTGKVSLASLLASPTAVALTTITRRAAPGTPAAGNTYSNRVLEDVGAAATAAEPIVAPGGTYVSCLGTTLATVGGDVKKQEAIDLTMNTELATRAKKDGAETMILVSTAGANASSWFAYPRMKGQLEDNVKALGFERTIILRPGALLHDNERADARMAESVMIKVIKGMRAVGVPTTSLGVDYTDVGQAIAQLAQNPPDGFTTVYDAEIVKLAAEFRASQK